MTIELNKSDSLINRGLSLNLKTINNNLYRLFKRYFIALNKITGNELIQKIQTFQQVNDLNIHQKYNKGRIIFKNNIDKLRFLIENRERVANLIGVTPQQISNSKREHGIMAQLIKKMSSIFDLGCQDQIMQLYVSMYAENSNTLDIKDSWVEYIFNQDWIDNLCDTYLNSGKIKSSDSTLNYISYVLEGMMKDHEIDFHKDDQTFEEYLYIDKNDEDDFIEAYNKLNSFQRLNYGFYEIFKPIGGTNEKYIKINLSTDGILDIQGVVGLSDCEHVKWEYSSMEYLRSLNTGNQRYDFKLTLPFNDGNSKLWWKPDEKEEIPQDDEEETTINDEKPEPTPEPDEEEPTKPEIPGEDFTGVTTEVQTDLNDILEGLLARIRYLAKLSDYDLKDYDLDDWNPEEPEPEKKYKYYKEYEKERFLRWFGSDHIPLLDLNNISKKTICSIPVLKNDVQENNRFEDSNNIITNPNLTKINIDTSTSQSLLTLAPKSTIDIIEKVDELGNRNQYVRFIVSGNQQTSNIAFHITGKMLTETTDENGNMIPNIQDINHYANTIKKIGDLYVKIQKAILFIETVRNQNALLSEVWTKVKGDLEYIPSELIAIKWALESILRYPTIMDLIRLRQIDFDAIDKRIDQDIKPRTDFISNIFESIDKQTRQELIRLGLNEKSFRSDSLWNIINQFNDLSQDELNNLLSQTKLSSVSQDELLQTIQQFIDVANYDFSYATTINELRTSIQTFCNLVVRLPTDTKTQRTNSLHIFQDWKNFVDKSLEHLVKNEQLIKVDGFEGTGTDNVSHQYSEYFIEYDPEDESKCIPFIDYSYCYDENGSTIHDRWDFWTEDDFILDSDETL